MLPSFNSSLLEITGTLRRERWRPPDARTTGNSFVIAELEDGTSIKGDAPLGDLTPGLPYRFLGKWGAEHHKFGKAFEFTGFIKSEPHSRFGLVKYLAKHAPGIGPSIAGLLFDCYGTNACSFLRNCPTSAAEDVNRTAGRTILTEEAAHHAAVALRALSLLEDTRIDLANLLAGRGFPGSLTEELIRRWGPLAPVRIKRDPLSLMILGLPGCGFGRCDKLYCDLGLPLGRVKRQMLCLWKALKDDGQGHTWQSLEWCERALKRAIAGAPANVARALQLGCRSSWLARSKDEAGQWWVAQGEQADAEADVVDCVGMLATWERPEACSDLGTPAEYVEWLAYGAQRIAIHELQREAEELIQEAGQDVEELTAGQKASIGQITGVCQFCGRVLVNAESRRRGYGPVCAEKWGLPV